MKWLKETDILHFLSQHNYDVRISKNARWIDQKCTADVISIVSDCILQYYNEHKKTEFTTKDIWHNEYTVNNVQYIFKKPNLNETKAKHEYDKFFQQPMEMLSYSGVLTKTKRRNRNFYSISNAEVLEYISISERNALAFLHFYIEKVLKDSQLYFAFEEFFKKQTKQAYIKLKQDFADFTIRHTKIKGRTECHRVFTKVLNPLAYKNNKHGTERGHLSKDKITYDMLMYNRDNFRDIYTNKPKGLTRQEYAKQISYQPSKSYSKYMSQKAKRVIRIFNDNFRKGITEVAEPRHEKDKAIHIHHIFPENEFPGISAYYENLIALTPTQHLSYAHPNGDTSVIDVSYQHICLLAKSSVIQETIEDSTRHQIYEFKKFTHVLHVGLDDDRFNNIPDGDFDAVNNVINLVYS